MKSNNENNEASPPPQIFNNQDVVLRLMEFLGPRHVCTGIGASCRDLCQLSRSDALWRVFWEARCLFTTKHKQHNDDGDGVVVHKAAAVFRHAIYEMDLADKIIGPPFISQPIMGKLQPNNEEEVRQSKSEDDELTLYHAYIQKHSMMKLTNLRVKPFVRPIVQTDKLKQSNLCSPLCSQTWPGQLSNLVPNNMHNIEGNTIMTNRVTCLNSAEAWCDAPTCDRARCGPQGCLRCYRFLPRDYSMSAGGQIMAANRECSERDYDMTSFVKCSWCSVSFCNEHLLGYGGTKQPWYKCDECKLSSCSDCVSQVFLSPPNMEGCRVITAGKPCHRNVCTKCTWYVGKKKQNISRNIPGGNYAQSADGEVITMKGVDLLNDKDMEWEDVETSCSKCLRHVEFRWRELEQVRQSFGGLIP